MPEFTNLTFFHTYGIIFFWFNIFIKFVIVFAVFNRSAKTGNLRQKSTKIEMWLLFVLAPLDNC